MCVSVCHGVRAGAKCDFCIFQPDSCTPSQCEGQGTARLAAGDVTPGQAMAAMHKIASTDHRPPPICRDARLGVGGCTRLNPVVELIALSQSSPQWHGPVCVKGALLCDVVKFYSDFDVARQNIRKILSTWDIWSACLLSTKSDI